MKMPSYEDNALLFFSLKDIMIKYLIYLKIKLVMSVITLNINGKTITLKMNDYKIKLLKNKYLPDRF